MADQYGDLGAIATAVQARLIAQIASAKTGTVRISQDPNSGLQVPTDDRWYIVTPSPQVQYDQEAVDGGGRHQLTGRTRILVTVHFVENATEADDIEQFWSDASRSINAAKKEVLKALHDWLPVDGDGVPLSSDPLLAAGVDWSKAASAGSIQIAFDVDYDEDLDMADV